MGRALRFLAAFGVACVFVAPASARTYGPAPLEFSWPATGTVTGRFGEWRGSHVHSGVDIGILESLTVRAATRGVVTRVGTPRGYSGYGNTVIVRYGHVEALYAHLAAIRVRRGQRVEAGDRIGVAGCTGWCTGTHLHFELRDHGRLLNPLTYLG